MLRATICWRVLDNFVAADIVSPLCELCSQYIAAKYAIQVRASNVVELIYKQGQAGVTKATVSIKFDNTDAQNMPVGYEDQEKITVTRQVRTPAN
jgi:hypothetical protein